MDRGSRITVDEEDGMRRKWTLLAIAASVALTAMAVTAGASAAADAVRPESTSGACAGLTEDPEALAEMQALRAEKRQAWQAWFEKYATSAERGSEEAQAEKQQLREQYRRDMTALLEKYGVEVPEGAGPGSRAGAGKAKGGCQGGGMGGGMMRGASL
jgi:hypothetical protein